MRVQYQERSLLLPWVVGYPPAVGDRGQDQLPNGIKVHRFVWRGRGVLLAVVVAAVLGVSLLLLLLLLLLLVALVLLLRELPRPLRAVHLLLELLVALLGTRPGCGLLLLLLLLLLVVVVVAVSVAVMVAAVALLLVALPHTILHFPFLDTGELNQHQHSQLRITALTTVEIPPPDYWLLSGEGNCGVRTEGDRVCGRGGGACSCKYAYMGWGGGGGGGAYLLHSPPSSPLPLPPPHGKKERDGMKGVQTWARGWEKDSRHIFLESLFVLFLNLIL